VVVLSLGSVIVTGSPRPGSTVVVVECPAGLVISTSTSCRSELCTYPVVVSRPGPSAAAVTRP
jgi:hypothetical protein